MATIKNIITTLGGCALFLQGCASSAGNSATKAMNYAVQQNALGIFTFCHNDDCIARTPKELAEKLPDLRRSDHPNF